DGDGDRPPVRVVDLRHSDLATDESRDWHLLFPFDLEVVGPQCGVAFAAAPLGPRPQPVYFECSLPNALISTSTPAGRSSFMSASTVCGVGSKMSSRRLCVRSSSCSRLFLSTCGLRSTVQRFLTVGSGIGPATRAPVRRAVSTISLVDW